jgi:hypothetical protein
VNSILAGLTRSRGVGGAVERAAEAPGKTREEIEKEFFRRAADFADQTLRRTDGGGHARRLRREPARLGNDRRGPARRRRSDQERVLANAFQELRRVESIAARDREGIAPLNKQIAIKCDRTAEDRRFAQAK